MKDVAYIVMGQEGVRRLTKRWPSLSRDEIAVKVTISAPDGAFRSPVLAATMDVKDQHVIQPSVTVEPQDAPADE